eukprot:COSAG02_NODE_1446_length_12578_cov_3.488661_6_plen_63_part_00
MFRGRVQQSPMNAGDNGDEIIIIVCTEYTLYIVMNCMADSCTFAEHVQLYQYRTHVQSYLIL